MRLLLDTHVLLWALSSPERLGNKARSAIEDPSNDVMFSAASIWEIAVKWSLKRLDFTITPGEILTAAIESGFNELPVRSAVAAHVASLPPHHRDPFDRLLVAQAIMEPIILYTADSQMDAYSELVRRI